MMLLALMIVVALSFTRSNHPQCLALRRAYVSLQVESRAVLGAGVSVESLAGCAGVHDLHDAHRGLQRELAHELVAGDRRALQAAAGEADRRRLVSFARGDRLAARDPDPLLAPVSYTHLTLPTILLV